MSRTSLAPNGTIYLSGGMQHATDLGGAWRDTCSAKLRELDFFPLNITAMDVAYSKLHGDLARGVENGETLLQFKSNIRKQYIETDINLIRNDSDALIIYYDESVRRGAGTISEIHDAYMNDIPVFLVNGYSSLKDIPGWMQAETTVIFNTFSELYDYLAALPAGILKRDIYGNRRSGTHYLCSLCGAVEQKHKTQFVSKISPQYCKSCVDLVKTTFERHTDRYQFFLNYMEQEQNNAIRNSTESQRDGLID